MIGLYVISGMGLAVATLFAFLNTKSKSVKLEGEANDVIEFFRKTGFSLIHAVAIAGNLQEESQFKTTALGDNGTAFGLAQWRGSRLNDLKRFAKDNGSNYKDFYTQLYFILNEFQTTEKKAFAELKKTNDLYNATIAFAKYYERPLASTYPKRVAYANEIMTNFNNLL